MTPKLKHQIVLTALTGAAIGAAYIASLAFDIAQPRVAIVFGIVFLYLAGAAMAHATTDYEP